MRTAPDPRTLEEEADLLAHDPEGYWEWWNRTSNESDGDYDE
jgi:hypothetical protein